MLPALLNRLFPPLCLVCDEPSGGAASLCVTCWEKIRFIAPPLCAGCGAPFDLPVGDGLLCGVCVLQKPLYDSARAALLYDENSRKIVLGFKHGDQTHAAASLAAWMHRAAADLLADIDYLVPVPLHRARLFQRRYNQSALLAQHLGALAGKPVLFETLRRARATPSQGHRKRAERQENMRGAFTVPPRAAGRIVGQRLALIDDVMTTGATVEECAKTLRAAGAREIHVVTLARVWGAM